MRVEELLSEIAKRDLVLPEFQREYVWSKEKAKQLMMSLYRGYPIGSLLFWKTDSPPELKNLDITPDRLGTIQVILDGQQRLTTLYLLVIGDIPPYYTEVDLQKDPRELYFNLDNGEFQYYQALRMKDNPRWIKVTKAFNDSEIHVFKIAKKISDDEIVVMNLAEKYNDKLNMLKGIAKVKMTIQRIPSQASLDKAIDVFDRVNSLGTKLTDAELALTHVTGKWSSARRELKKKIESMTRNSFAFNLNFITRALTCVVTNHALYETIHKRQKEELIEGWKRVSRILDYLINVLPSQAHIHSTNDINTSNTLIPLVAFLSVNNGHFPNDMSQKHAIHWLYAAHIWARYTAQTDQRLEHDVTLVVREEAPWNSLREQIIDQRGRIEVKSSDFEGRWVQHPLYRMILILAKAHGAVDWFNGMHLHPPFGQAYKIQNHHIFPQSQLYKHGYDQDNHLHRKIVNEIANRAFLTADTNIDISDRLPEDYFPEVEESYPGALVHQFIPMVPELWKIEKYADFLEARREILARKLNEFLANLITEPEPVRERQITDLVRLGESVNLEFKSTLRWDIIENQVNKSLQHSVLKTIAAFLNTDGGTLLIGVDDSGEIYGLKNDLKTLRKSRDKFIQLLSSLINDHIGPAFAQFIKIHLEKVEKRYVCVVDVDKSSEPAFLKGVPGGIKEFYVRVGNTSRSLDPQETVSYVEMRSI